MITDWHDLIGHRREFGHIAGVWQELTGHNTIQTGVRRIQIDPDAWSTPFHVEGSEEEMFFVLAGSGASLQDTGRGPVAHAVAAGDFLVHLPRGHAHTLRAGPEGLDVLAFGERHNATAAYLPRAGCAWLGRTWVSAGEPGHPFEREAAIGPPELPPLTPPSRFVVSSRAVESTERNGSTVGYVVRDLGRAAGSVSTGMKLFDVSPGKLHNPPHCHSAEEEIFVVLAGSGVVEHWPHPRAETEPDRFGHEGMEPAALRPGCTLSRPAGASGGHRRHERACIWQPPAERHRLLPAIGKDLVQGSRHACRGLHGRGVLGGRGLSLG